MKRSTVLILALAFALLALAPAVGAGNGNDNFTASLSGRNELPANDSNAAGQFILKVRSESLGFKLIAANIDGVTQAHIHCGAVDVNGPIVAFLFGFVGEGVNVNGILSQGTITDADVIPRPDSPECPGGVADFDELVAKIRSGDAYVNIHTLAFPGGEIRGQIK